jgi:site-specific recombinase XerD
MARSPAQVTHSTVRSNLPPFGRHLRAEGKSPSTIVTYGKAVDQLAAFLEREGYPTDVRDVRRLHVEAFLVAMQMNGARPATVSQRFRSLQQYWKWLVEEDEIGESPMARMRPPQVPIEPPPVLSEDDLKALLKTCAGTDFDDRRDTAVIRLFLDTGVRRGELAGLRVADVDPDADSILVIGKGRRPRVCPYGKKTAAAIDRYLRVRARRQDADSEWLWLGKRGRLTENGVEQMVKRRGDQAGLRVHPHLFRHTYAHMQLADGMQEGDLMQLAGWRSRQMLGRYGASAAAERARQPYRQHSPGDRL